MKLHLVQFRQNLPLVKAKKALLVRADLVNVDVIEVGLDELVDFLNVF